MFPNQLRRKLNLPIRQPKNVRDSASLKGHDVEMTQLHTHAINIVSMCRNTFNFFDSLTIFRHYFTGNGKVSCVLATISD